jgi:hypothetical protein
MEYLPREGVVRDHAVVRDSSVVARLDALADKKQAYRSSEQRFNDKRQATGYQPQGPLSFGAFEVGRSSMPEHCQPSSQFLDTSKLGVVYPHMDGHTEQECGDPGAYHPYDGGAGVYSKSTLAESARFTKNMGYKAFGSLEKRDLHKVRGRTPGEGSPGPGTYRMADGRAYLYATINPVRMAFNSASLQRPKNDTPVPGPGSYEPKRATSVDANIRDSGNSMRSVSAAPPRPSAHMRPHPPTH